MLINLPVCQCTVSSVIDFFDDSLELKLHVLILAVLIIMPASELEETASQNQDV